MNTYKEQEAQKKAERFALNFFIGLIAVAGTACFYLILSGKVIG